MSTLKITSGKDTNTAKFIFGGQEVKSVIGCDIQMPVHGLLTAVLDLYIDEISIEAEPLLSFRTVEEAANRYGFKLVPLDEK